MRYYDPQPKAQTFDVLKETVFVFTVKTASALIICPSTVGGDSISY